MKKKTQIVQTCKSCATKKTTTLCQEEIAFALVVAEEILREWDQRKTFFKIVDIIDKELRTCPRPKTNKLIMERILSNTTLVTNMLVSFLPPKVVITTQKLVAWMCTSLVVSWPYLGLATKARAWKGATWKYNLRVTLTLPKVWENVKEWAHFGSWSPYGLSNV